MPALCRIVERAANIRLPSWSAPRPSSRARANTRWFAATLIASACLSAALASWLPLQVSIVTVFLFAGPHNWFELRYFLMHLPARFGRSQNFFAVAFVGILLLTVFYLAMPALYYANVWSGANWPEAIATWNTLLLLWLGALVIMRGRQSFAPRLVLGNAGSVYVVRCELVGAAAFQSGDCLLPSAGCAWFLDRHLRRTRPEWLRTYRRCLILLPLLIGGMLWQLSRTAPLSDDNGLFWRITQHAGADLLPNVSSHVLVSLHLFLEVLHYGVWIVALPLIGATGAVWKVDTIPLARRRHGFPRLITAVLTFGLCVVGLLWFGFSVNYPVMRDVYFAVAIAHVLAEAPFLLR